MADTGEDAVCRGAVWRKPWRMGGNVSVPSQNQTLVFCDRNACNPRSTDHNWGFLSGTDPTGNELVVSSKTERFPVEIHMEIRYTRNM